MTPPRITETQEGLTVAEFLAMTLDGNTVGFHVPNEHSGKWERINATKAGALWGMTDWVVIDDGRAVCFELKERGWREKKLLRGTSKLTTHERRQLDVHARLRRAGCPVAICETLGEVVWFLEQHGVPMRSTDVVPTPIPPRLADMVLGLPNTTLDDIIDAEAAR